MTNHPRERDVVRAARLDSLSVLLTRIANGRTLTPEEARLLVEHVSAEVSESTTARAAAADLARRAEQAEAERDELAQRLSESRSAEAILGQRVLGWAALASSHQRWGQRRWNAWKSARNRARNWQVRAEHAEAALKRVRAAAKHFLHEYEGGEDPCAAAVLAALDEPAPAPAAPGLRWTVATQADTHTWTGDAAAATAWLAGHPHHWNDGQLVIDTIDGPIPAPTGWILARWPDGDITVMSPRAAAKRLRP